MTPSPTTGTLRAADTVPGTSGVAGFVYRAVAVTGMLVFGSSRPTTSTPVGEMYV